MVLNITPVVSPLVMPQKEIRMAVLADQDPIPQDTLDNDLDTLRDAARLIYPGVGSMLYDWWETINEAYFGRQMTPPGIQFGLTPHGKTHGKWRGYEQTIILHRSLLDPSGNAWGKRDQLGNRFAWDVLLHEMVHQYIDTVRGISPDDARSNSPQNGDNVDGGSPHNCPSWVAEINRLSQELDLDCTAAVVKQRRVDGQVKWSPPEGFDMSIGDVSSWPWSVRPDGYYRNDPNPAFELDEQDEERDPNEQDEQGRDLDEMEQELENELNKIFQ